MGLHLALSQWGYWNVNGRLAWNGEQILLIQWSYTHNRRFKLHLHRIVLGIRKVYLQWATLHGHWAHIYPERPIAVSLHRVAMQAVLKQVNERHYSIAGAAKMSVIKVNAITAIFMKACAASSSLGSCKSLSPKLSGPWVQIIFDLRSKEPIPPPKLPGYRSST